MADQQMTTTAANAPPLSVDEQMLGLPTDTLRDRAAFQCWAKANCSRPTGTRRKLIIDCDPGIDDAEALVLCLSEPTVDVIAISTVAGNIDPHQGARNVHRALRACGQPDIPVYVGCERPLVAPLKDAKFYHGEDGFGELFPAADPSTEPVQDGHAVNALTRLSREHMIEGKDDDPCGLTYRAKVFKTQVAALELRIMELQRKQDFVNAARIAAEISTLNLWIRRCVRIATQTGFRNPVPEIELLALGPMTNVAMACRMDVAFPLCVRSLTSMGGTLHGEGNVRTDPTNEFNFHCDPEAVSIVFAEFPVLTLVTWEACLAHRVEWDKLLAIVRDGMAGKREFLTTISEFAQKRDSVYVSRGYVPVDPLAASVLLWPLDMVSGEAVETLALRYAQMELKGDLTRGQLTVDWNNHTQHMPNVFLIKDININAYLAKYKEMMFQ